MLQKQTVAPQLMELLDKIMSEPLFSDFYLVGGTALALQIGHRNSVDIDLFGYSEINFDLFIQQLSEYGETHLIQSTKNILITNTKDIKVDFVRYNYPLLAPSILLENIRMLSKIDIAAMKLNEIIGRGSKKDFIDLYFLLNEFSLKEMIVFYEKKYKNGSVFMVYKSLTYFDDAEQEQQPKMYLNFEWEMCKDRIINEVKQLN